MEVSAGLEEAVGVRTLSLANTKPLMMMTFSHRAPTSVTPVYRPGSPGAIRSARERSRSPGRSGSPEDKLPPLSARPSTMMSTASIGSTPSPRTRRPPSPSRMSDGRFLLQERLERQELLDLKMSAADEYEVDNPTARAVNTSRGFAKFCEALKSNPSLTCLRLQNNRIGDQNARLLAYAVFWPRKPRITKLSIEGNALEEPPPKLAALAGLELGESLLHDVH